MAKKSAINLIPGLEKAAYEVLKLQKTFRRLSYFALGLLFVGLFTSFSLFIILSSRNRGLLSQIYQKESAIKNYQQREGYLFLLKNRLDLINQVFQGRLGAFEVFKELEVISPAGISYQIIEANSRKSLKLSVSSADLNSMDDFMRQISDPSYTKDFSLITLSSISRSEKGNYRFFLELAKK